MTAGRRIVNPAETRDNRRIVKLSTYKPTQSQARTPALEEETAMGRGEEGRIDVTVTCDNTPADFVRRGWQNLASCGK